MAHVSFKLEGMREMLRKFDKLPDDVKQAFDDELTQTADEIVTEAKALSNSSVDVGKLKNSIKVTVNEPLHKRVSATAAYAAYVEFGTGTMVSIPGAPKGLQEYAIQFKGKGVRQINLPARPYFFPAWQSRVVGLPKRLKEIIEEEAGK